MRIIRLNIFKRDYKKLSLNIKEQADKKISFLVNNINHPSLRIKKIQGSKDIWEGRVTRDIRFTFQIIKDIYILRRIGRHDETLKNP